MWAVKKQESYETHKLWRVFHCSCKPSVTEHYYSFRHNLYFHKLITSPYITISRNLSTNYIHYITVMSWLVHQSESLHHSNLKHGSAHLLCMYGFLLGCLATDPDVNKTSTSTVLERHLQNMATGMGGYIKHKIVISAISWSNYTDSNCGP